MDRGDLHTDHVGDVTRRTRFFLFYVESGQGEVAWFVVFLDPMSTVAFFLFLLCGSEWLM